MNLWHHHYEIYMFHWIRNFIIFFFVFCLFKQKELCFDDKLVLNQIRYTGLLQIVHIQKSGYSAKYTFEVGIRFNVILLINVYK